MRAHRDPFQKEKKGRRRSQSTRRSPTLTNPSGRVITVATEGSTMRVVFVLLLGGVLAVSLARNASAQTSTGSIRGYVTDSSGTPLEGARVVAVSALNGAQREVTTQARGVYALLGLTPGEYDVTAPHIRNGPQRIHVRVLIGEV